MNNANRSASALRRALAGKLQSLLDVSGLSDWVVKINPKSSHGEYDLLATGKTPNGPSLELCVDCRPEARPSRFPCVTTGRVFNRTSIDRVRTQVFAAPYISPRMAEVCESHGWGWFDLAGNCKITVPTFLYIERCGMKPVHEAPRPTANLGSPEASRVIRALLTPDNAGWDWTQRYLKTHFGELASPIRAPSLGLVNKIVRRLREEAFIDDLATGGFRLRDPLKLLFAWRDAYRFDRQERRGYFTLKKGRELNQALASLSAHTGGFAEYASFSAADFQAPHVRQSKTWLYVRAHDTQLFEELAQATPADSGENIVLLTPNDDGVFYLGDGGCAGEPRMACTNAVQTYVDLWHSGGRGKEAAEALLEQRLRPEWKLRGMTV